MTPDESPLPTPGPAGAPQPQDPSARRILLYVDDSSDWHQAARLLGEYIRHAGGQLTIASSLLLPRSRARAMEKARELVGLPEAQVELVGRAGLVEYMLPDTAKERKADLVVLGRLGSADRLTSGLISLLIVRRTHSSVLLARKLQEVRSILVCTEGKRHGLVNFLHAARFAQAFGARLTVLHVISQMGLTDHGRAELEEDLLDFVRSDAPEADHLRDLEARMKAMGIDGAVRIRQGLVVEQILEAIQEGRHDLLVIGAHETASPSEWMYEDFASSILRASPVSTLIVRDGGP